MKNKALFALVFTILFLLTPSVFAYQLSPLNVTYDPTGSNSQKVYTIINDSDSPIAIELKAVKRNIDLDGQEYLEDASNYFQIQPAKTIIKPQSSQLIRVQYRGPKAITKEQSFRIISEQIPFSSGASQQEKGQMINFLFVYSTSAYVKPSRVIEKVEAAVSETSEGKLEIIFENTGSVHQMLNDLKVTIKGASGAQYTLTDDEMGDIKGANLLCSSKLRIIIPRPDVFSASDNLSVDFSYNYRYSG